MTLSLPSEPIYRTGTSCIGDTVVVAFNNDFRLVVTPRQNDRGKILGTVNLELKMEGQTLAKYTCKNPAIAGSEGELELWSEKTTAYQFLHIWKDLYDETSMSAYERDYFIPAGLRRPYVMIMATKPDLDDLYEKLKSSAYLQQIGADRA